MKHTHKITWILIALFFFSQIIGTFIVQKNINVVQIVNQETGQTTKSLDYVDTPYIETMRVEDESSSYIMIFVSVLIGTIIGLTLAKFNKFSIWKVWFLLAVIITLYKSFSVFIPAIAAITAGIVFGVWKIFRPNFYVHNFTELFIYAGIASIFVPILNVFSASILLILIAIYDAFAVWKSKHMITLAKFQSRAVFAGLSLQYDIKKDKLINSLPIKTDSNSHSTNMTIPKPTHEARIKQAEHPSSNIKNAILGGGDIAFPLLFSGAVMKGAMLIDSPATAYFKATIISVFATIAIGLLFYKAKKDTFYPAMPFIAAGCFIGYAVMMLV